jgi:hypothetical protein
VYFTDEFIMLVLQEQISMDMKPRSQALGNFFADRTPPGENI